MNENQGIRTWQWVVTVIVIIILIVLGYYLFKGDDTTTGTDNTPAPTESPLSNETNRVVVADQYPGNVVYISSVQLEKGGWVVVHKDNNGTPGAVIGSLYLDAGINPAKVTLTEKTVDGGTYYVMLHSDDGDKKFDAAKDALLKDSTGATVMKSFKASTNVTEVKG